LTEAWILNRLANAALNPFSREFFPLTTRLPGRLSILTFQLLFSIWRQSMKKFRVEIFLHVDEWFADESDESSDDDWWKGDTEADVEREDVMVFRFQRMDSVEIQAIDHKIAAAIAYREVVSPRRISLLKKIEALTFIVENECSILNIEYSLQAWPLRSSRVEFILNNGVEQWILKVNELS
jgi:hypothetical protein